MLSVFEGQHHAEAHFVQGLLEAEGVDALVRGESLFTTVEAASAIPGMRPAVWIRDESQAGKAREILARYAKGEGVPIFSDGPWACPQCAEVHEPQFSSCWKCGTSSPAPS